MKTKILVGGLIYLFLMSCTITFPINIYTTDSLSGDVIVPVKYVGGLDSLKKRTEGKLFITNSTTRFVSEKEIVHFNFPTSSISGVYAGDEIKRHFGKTLDRWLLKYPLALFIKDISEVIVIEFNKKEKNIVANLIFQIRVGTGPMLKKTIQAKHMFAATADTISAYEEFLKQHPDSEFADEARSRLNILILKEQWEITVTTDTISSYEEFLKQHSDSEFAEKARSRMDLLKRESPKKHWLALKNTIPAYEEFLNLHPDSEFAEEARSRLNLLKEESPETKALKKDIRPTKVKSSVPKPRITTEQPEAQAPIDKITPIFQLTYRDFIFNRPGRSILRNRIGEQIAHKTYLYEGPGSKILISINIYTEADGRVATIYCDSTGKPGLHFYLCLDREGNVIYIDGKPAIIERDKYRPIKQLSQTLGREGKDKDGRKFLLTLVYPMEDPDSVGVKGCRFVW